MIMENNSTEDIRMTPAEDEEIIPQDEERGPGWFLKISYLLIVAFCLFYLFAYWDWQSDYELQQAEEVQTETAVNQE